MKAYNYFICFLLVFGIANILRSQELSGFVNSEGEGLPSANIFWMGSQKGVVSDLDGHFKIPFPDQLPDQLVVSFVGFTSDTIRFVSTQPTSIEVELKKAVVLNEVTIEARQKSTSISLMNPRYIENISSKELTKAACCNLSESFQTNATVDVTFTDAVSGAKKIQMLGLDGMYTQMLFENIPELRGLSSSKGLEHIPGTWVDAIQVNKGSGSVVNGYESMAGQINIEMHKPDKLEPLALNVYANQRGRKEVNARTSIKAGDKWTTSLMLHANDLSRKNDINGDGFLDMPLKEQFTFMNRWKRQANGGDLQLGVRGLTEKIQGGQLAFYDGNPSAYRMNFSVNQLALYAKRGIIFEKRPASSIGLMVNTNFTEQNGNFGERGYSGIQKSAYFNSIYQTIIKTTDNTIKTGLSYVYDNYDFTFNDSVLGREELVPGVFAEYTMIRDKFTLIAGSRLDVHNLYGLKWSPRLNFKYNLGDLTVLRLLVGKGFRTANAITENSSNLISSRRLQLGPSLLPEEAWNYGGSITHKFNLFDREASLNVDYFNTNFINKVVIDLENPTYIRINNLEGKAYSNAVQLDLAFEPLKMLDIKMAYKYYHTRSTFNRELLQNPLIPLHRALFNLAYATKWDRWKFDFTTLWYGRSRIPRNAFEPTFTKSESYFVLNTQLTKKWKKWDIYCGIENLLEYQQNNPIVDPQNPYGPYFDASLIWGPINGRIIYLGINYKL